MIKAITSDMDGTIMDNMKVYQKAFLDFVNGKGGSLTLREYVTKYQGHSNKENFHTIFGRNLTKEEIQSFSNEKEGLHRSRYVDVEAGTVFF